MSWVIPPGIAARARSASAAERGCLARYCSWIVMRPIIARRSRARRNRQQRHHGRMRVERQAVDGRLSASRDAVARAGLYTGGDQPPLVVGGVEQRPAGESPEMRDDAIRAPV